MNQFELFRCIPYDCRITRGGCAKRHLRVVAGEQQDSDDCRRCAVGIAHEAGEQPTTWPDGTPIAIATTTTQMLAAGLPSPVVTGRFPSAGPNIANAPKPFVPNQVPPAPQKGPVMKAKLYEHDGRKQTLAQWAAELGIAAESLRVRFRRWGVERALSTAKVERKDAVTFRDWRPPAAEPPAEQTSGLVKGSLAALPRRAPEVAAFLSDVEPTLEMLTHTFLLRPGVMISATLPADLTVRDVERLTYWLGALPFDEKKT